MTIAITKKYLDDGWIIDSVEQIDDDITFIRLVDPTGSGPRPRGAYLQMIRESEQWCRDFISLDSSFIHLIPKPSEQLIRYHKMLWEL